MVDRAFAAYPDAELTVHAGDQINDAGEDAQWGQWFAGMGEHLAQTQTVTTLGNHELTIDPTASQYRAHYEYPRNGPITQRELVWYTDYQDVRFISLNGNAPLGGPDQAIWLKRLLADNPNTWTVVTFHQPMFSNTDGRDNIATRTLWLPIFEKYGVDLVLQGHDHTYARGHLADNERPDGSVVGPVYTVAVSGSKYYEPSDGTNNWTANDATRVVSHGDTSTFQAITVSDDTLTYRAVVGAVGENSTAPGGVGSTLDAFTIRRKADGTKRVVPPRG
ncbi:metallophosphoesterase family protein [Nocardioides sambongensis]|uniref:metallophosphoesterase family protein n=1 Tax=Nocardioides sambongensis TaxID=2589074 RepID=UPI0015E85597|nr:metallophosphoesterase [Nocardioides sambongensis]